MNSTRELFDECLSAVPEDVAKDVDEYIEHLNASKPKVLAVIERGVDGSYSIYSDDDNLPYLITGVGATEAEARKAFIGGYEDMKRVFMEDGKEFEDVEFEFYYELPKSR